MKPTTYLAHVVAILFACATVGPALGFALTTYACLLIIFGDKLSEEVEDNAD